MSEDEIKERRLIMRGLKGLVEELTDENYHNEASLISLIYEQVEDNDDISVNQLLKFISEMSLNDFR